MNVVKRVLLLKNEYDYITVFKISKIATVVEECLKDENIKTGSASSLNIKDNIRYLKNFGYLRLWNDDEKVIYDFSIKVII